MLRILALAGLLLLVLTPAHAANLSCLPTEILAAIQGAQAQCTNVKVISTFRKNARVRGSGRVSDHASCRAADLVGDFKCIYQALADFPGQVSKDWRRVRHIHVGMKGYGKFVRFNHYHPRRYAHRHGRRA